MIHIPVVVYSLICGLKLNIYVFSAVFMINWIIHAVTDNAKANLLKINLIQDQLIHVCQIIATWIVYC